MAEGHLHLKVDGLPHSGAPDQAACRMGQLGSLEATIMKPEDVPHRWLPAEEGGRYFGDFIGHERLSASQQVFLGELAAKLEELNLQGVDPTSTIAEL